MARGRKQRAPPGLHPYSGAGTLDVPALFVLLGAPLSGRSGKRRGMSILPADSSSPKLHQKHQLSRCFSFIIYIRGGCERAHILPPLPPNFARLYNHLLLSLFFVRNAAQDSAHDTFSPITTIRKIFSGPIGHPPPVKILNTFCRLFLFLNGFLIRIIADFIKKSNPFLRTFIYFLCPSFHFPKL